MPATLIDGKKLAETELAALRQRTAALPRPPRLVLLAQEAAAASVFLVAKQRAAHTAGIDVRLVTYPDDVSATALSARVNDVAQVAATDGVVVQLPLPRHLDGNRQGILRILPEVKDVDCLSERWLGRLVTGRMTVMTKHHEVEIMPPVVAACARILEELNCRPEGKHVVVVGWGDLVGKPVAAWFLNQGATVTVATSTEQNLASIVRMGEIVVSGAGVPGLITGDMIRPNAVLLDAGTTSVAGTLRGDIDTASVMEHAGALAPVPGGLGPLTVAMLLRNVVAVAGGGSE